jgi:hypothetical protein
MHRVKHLSAIILGRDKQILACETALVYRGTNELFVRVDCGIIRRGVKTRWSESPRYMAARRTSGSVNMGESRFEGSFDDVGHILKRAVG